MIAVWLLFLAIVNQKSRFPIISIFPYLFPVVFITWRHGLAWGFLFSAIASVAAMPGSYMDSHEMNDLYWASFTTYLKLSGAAAGIAFGKRIAGRHQNDQ